MLMTKIERPRWWYERIRPLAPPDDFEAKFIEIGRFACQEHYAVGRTTVNSWLMGLGKERLIALRKESVERKKEARRNRLTRADMRSILNQSFPVVDNRRVSPTLARHAAQYLRIVRNGGFIVSPTGAGDWRVGTRRVSPAQLVDMAKAKGFQA
jgi:hypothetical protein